MTYVTVYVGCIECGVLTEVIGVFPTEKEAKKRRSGVKLEGVPVIATEAKDT